MRTLALAACLALGVVATPAVAQTSTDTLAVDFAARTGPFRGGATGTLYGFGDDGKYKETIQYTAGRGWGYRGSTELTVDLPTGSHVLSVRTSADGATMLPNADITLDKFTLTDVTTGEPTVYPASTLRYYGKAGLTWTPNARGYGKITGSARADAYVTAMESGYHDVAVRYQTDRSSDLSLTVNGRTVATFAAPRAGEWQSTVRTHLPEGVNEIELTSTRGAQIASITTTRTPTADKAAVTLEAENATLNGTASAVTETPGSPTNASGGAHVEWIGQGAANNVEIPRVRGIDRPGAYDVVVHYANAELGSEHPYNPQVVDRRLDVTEVGAVVGSAYFRYTHTWNSYWDHTVQVSLTTKDSPLQLGNPEEWAPNIDRVTESPWHQPS